MVPPEGPRGTFWGVLGGPWVSNLVPGGSLGPRLGFNFNPWVSLGPPLGFAVAPWGTLGHPPDFHLIIQSHLRLLRCRFSGI